MLATSPLDGAGALTSGPCRWVLYIFHGMCEYVVFLIVVVFSELFLFSELQHLEHGDLIECYRDLNLLAPVTLIRCVLLV